MVSGVWGVGGVGVGGVWGVGGVGGQWCVGGAEWDYI